MEWNNWNQQTRIIPASPQAQPTLVNWSIYSKIALLTQTIAGTILSANTISKKFLHKMEKIDQFSYS
jgi:hypothetical protein